MSEAETLSKDEDREWNLAEDKEGGHGSLLVEPCETSGGRARQYTNGKKLAIIIKLR